MNIRYIQGLERFYIALAQNRYSALLAPYKADAMNLIADALVRDPGTDTTTIVHDALVPMAQKAIQDTMDKRGVNREEAAVLISSIPNIYDQFQEAANVNQRMQQNLGSDTITSQILPVLQEQAMNWPTICQEALQFIQ